MEWGGYIPTLDVGYWIYTYIYIYVYIYLNIHTCTYEFLLIFTIRVCIWNSQIKAERKIIQSDNRISSSALVLTRLVTKAMSVLATMY